MSRIDVRFLGGRMDWVYRQVADLSRGWLLGALALSTCVRLGYALVVMDPLSGPDAPTYVEAAPAIATQGFNGDIPGVPCWPAGYPAFLSAFYVMSPTHWSVWLPLLKSSF